MNTKASSTQTVRSWLGIPYATAERFRSPVLLPYNPNLPYDKKGAAPLQAGNTSWLEADSGFSEDCLNLNIWASENIDNKPLPVVVYIFGGGWMSGANSQTVSNASGLASTGRVIGISINYRLGAFGALSLSQYGGALADATNLCLQDIIAALKWIKQNIAQFGGDPNNVTITGHSAGAFSALALLAAPSADGLFHRIAAFSGMPSRQVPAWSAEERAIEVLSTLGIENNPEQLLNIEGKLLADTMNKTVYTDPGLGHGVDNECVATVDDRNLPNGVLIDHPMCILESGRHKDIDILFSNTTYETGYWVLHKTDDFDPKSIDNLVKEFANRNRIPRSRAKKIIDTYNVDERTPVEIRGLLLTDFSFTLPQTRGAFAHAAAGGKSYLLCVGPVEGVPAVHGTEMYGIVGQQSPNASEEQIVRDNFVRDALIDFATGNHNQLWKPVTTELNVKGIGNPPYDPTIHALDVLKIFEGIERP